MNQELPFERMMNDHLLVKIDSFEYKGKLVIPEIAKRKPTKGDVIQKADNITDIQVGDKIMYSQYAGYLVVIDGVACYRVIGISEILGIMNPNYKGEMEIGQ